MKNAEQRRFKAPLQGGTEGMEPLQGDFCGARRSSVFRSRGTFSELNVGSHNRLSRNWRAWNGRVRVMRDCRAVQREELKTKADVPLMGGGLFRNGTAIRTRRSCAIQDRGIRVSVGGGVIPQRQNSQRLRAAHNVQEHTVGHHRPLLQRALPTRHLRE
jgi:hypothetical protein